jgi:hypothetical protein
MQESAIPGAPSVPFFRMKGASMHAIGAWNAADGVQPSFMQCFFLETTTGVNDRTGCLQTPAELTVLRNIHDEGF